MVSKTTLPNGVRIVSERLPFLPSFTLGFWFFVGSRNEGNGEEGITHFIEHMVFRGTKKRSSFDISNEVDKRGGVINGFTTKEFTCFYVKLLKEFIDVGVDVLSDIVFNPLFKEEDLRREKTVVLHEIKSSMETPDDRVFDLFYEGYWKGSSLSHPILGKFGVISNVEREDIVSYFTRMFRAGNLVISLSGDVEHDDLVDKVTKYWGDIGDGGGERRVDARISPGIYQEEKDIEQIHVVIGFEGFSSRDDERYPLHLLNTYLGSGMSSILFQRIREKLGIAYSIYSFYQVYSDTGLFGIYFATTRENIEKAISEIGDALNSILKDGISEKRLREVKDQTKGNIVLALENSESRMGRIAKNEFFYGRNIPIEETLESLERVSQDDILRVAESTIKPEKLGMAFLGPISGLNTENLMECLRSKLKG